ncbi:DUF6932 family protein [Marinomonas spartinae]|uniref:DUF6932 family protein n=1 Tax=Marinomonas spartinae TaxID=1792290 RepID=UPI0018F11AB6|nr:hypothetical protein [Marinomonas spartinae]MBJ7555419.1 hypothetical protein [Marinomonas spartinae]
MSQKETFEPLYNGGFHVKTLGQIKSELVDAFPLSQTRLILFNKFSLFLDHLINKLHVKPDTIWIDGSYTTVKENPADIDILVVFDKDSANAMSQNNQKDLKQLIANKGFSSLYSCDVYWVSKGDQEMMSYWRGWYGFDRKDNAKGIIKLTMEEPV